MLVGFKTILKLNNSNLEQKDTISSQAATERFLWSDVAKILQLPVPLLRDKKG